jgi:hypothetical protein
MQVYAEDLVDVRPVPDAGCPGHLGVGCPQFLERCGCYLRFYSADSVEKDAVVLDFRCEVCCAHFSVIPENMEPYRRVPSDIAQRYGDQQSRFDSGASQLPLDDEVPEPFFPAGRQRPILQSYWLAFEKQSVVLAGIHGFPLDCSPEMIWRQLRQKPYASPPASRCVSSILLDLRTHHTALTKCYLSLKPWWQGGLARGWRRLTNRTVSARAP